MAIHDKAANRYAKAIFDSQSGKAEAKEVFKDLSLFANSLEVSEELVTVLTSNLFGEEQRENVLKDVAKRLKISSDATHILMVILKQRRIDAFETILEKLNFLILESASIIPVQVQSAAPLAAEEKASIEKQFRGILGKGVEASYQIDPTLIGGLRVTASGKTYDGSVSGWLSSFEEQSVGGNS